MVLANTILKQMNCQKKCFAKMYSNSKILWHEILTGPGPFTLSNPLLGGPAQTQAHLCLYRGFFCLSWLSFASLHQLNSLLQVCNLPPTSLKFLCKSEAALVRRPPLNHKTSNEGSLALQRTELGHYKLKAMNGAEAGKQMKVKKSRRSNDKETGIFAFTF